MTLAASPQRPALALGLTPEQRAIVEADDGPVVVIAGAGTGKTRVIVERVRWLLETKGDLAGPRAAAAAVATTPGDVRSLITNEPVRRDAPSGAARRQSAAAHR